MKPSNTNQNGFKDMKPVKNNKFVSKILEDVTGINLTEQEISKLKVFLRYEAKGTLFESIEDIYSIIGANFTKPSRFLIIPFIKKGSEHINIQKI
jgi:flagellin-specific chaperone FliS